MAHCHESKALVRDTYQVPYLFPIIVDLCRKLKEKNCLFFVFGRSLYLNTGASLVAREI
jgi:predicted solute-binding protein